jgi:hypothetical protein
MKKANGQRGPEKLGQNDPAFSSTAEILAKQYKWPTRGFYLARGENIRPSLAKSRYGLLSATAGNA